MQLCSSLSILWHWLSLGLEWKQTFSSPVATAVFSKFLWRPTRPFRNYIPKRCPFHYREQECKSRKSRNTWSNRQIWPWSTEWSRAKAIEFCQENALVIANTLFQQHKTLHMDITDGQHWNQIDYILCSQRWRISIQSAKTRPGADCGSDHELSIAKSDLNWRK